MSLQVIPCRTKVKTVIGGISALVTGICIRETEVSYEISYFHSGLSVSCWVKRYEFEVDTQVRKPAGLVNYDPPMEPAVMTLYLGAAPHPGAPTPGEGTHGAGPENNN